MNSPREYVSRFRDEGLKLPAQRRTVPGMATSTPGTLSKVAAVTLGFWVIKGLATTLCETGGDARSMQLGWGYAGSTLEFRDFTGATRYRASLPRARG